MDLSGRPGDLVTLLPLADAVEGITTEGLQYPLRDEGLRPGPARGLSNVRLGREASVTVRRGLLLVVESPVPEAG
jgi:thiamine pyrophosphokinase